jgi:hypothetical protein
MKNFLILSVLIVSLLTLSCGGGGGSNSGGSGGPGAPSISNLQTGPFIFLSKFSRNYTVTGRVDFYDPDGNVSKVNIKTPFGTNSTAANTTATSGQLTASVSFTTNETGQFSFEVWVTDATGLESNHLSGTITIV